MNALQRIARELHIPVQSIDEAGLTCRKPSEESLKRTLATLHQAFGREEILFGGTTAQPMLLGYRTLRNPSHNLDFALNEAGFSNLRQNLDTGLFYDKRRDAVYFGFNSMLVQCFYSNILGWEIPGDFQDRTIRVPITAEGERHMLAIASPEYTIMLKFRKAEAKRQADPPEVDQRMSAEKQRERRIQALRKMLPGKDRQDIFLFLLAPYFKHTSGERAKDEIKLLSNRVAELCYTDVTSDLQVMGEWLSALYADRSSLTAAEKTILMDQAGDIFSRAFASTYAAHYLPRL